MKEDDRALAEFRGFEHIAHVYIPELTDADIVQQLETIVENIQNALQKKKVVILSN